MTLQFKSRRTYRNGAFRKFKRCKLKDWDSTNKDIKAEEWEKCYITLDWKYIKKFLHSNIGKSFNKVYPEFLKRWNAPRYSPMKEIMDVIEYCGFKVVDGVIKLKKEKKFKPIDLSEFDSVNKERWENVKLETLIKRLRETNTAQYIGDFYIYKNHEAIEKSIYMNYYSPIKYDYERSRPHTYHNIKTVIPNVGYGIGYQRITTGTGKVKETYSIITSPFQNPIIYFYYKD